MDHGNCLNGGGDVPTSLLNRLNIVIEAILAFQRRRSGRSLSRMRLVGKHICHCGSRIGTLQ
jgi:hypothetical protein